MDLQTAVAFWVIISWTIIQGPALPQVMTSSKINTTSANVQPRFMCRDIKTFSSTTENLDVDMHMKCMPHVLIGPGDITVQVLGPSGKIRFLSRANGKPRCTRLANVYPILKTRCGSMRIRKTNGDSLF